MKNKIEDLRNHLFATLEALQDQDNPMDIDRAKVVAEVAQVIVNSAKVEVDFLRATDSLQGSGFIPGDQVPIVQGRSSPRLVGGGRP